MPACRPRAGSAAEGFEGAPCSATGLLSRLATSDVRNGRTVAGTLLRSCVVPKVSYLCRTVGSAA
jgi:hypothetical protein